MRQYKADIHLHTVLSPCGDIEMTPAFIIRRAKECGLDIVGITDHNSTLQCEQIRMIAEREGIFVLCGAEVTTVEEVHCLAFMEDSVRLAEFQSYLSRHLPRIENNPDLFGYQLIVNEQEQVLGQEEYLLISGIGQTIDQLQRTVHDMGGIFIPAHVDKRQNGLMSQLGFMPSDISVDALEISCRMSKDEFVKKYPSLSGYTLISSSDAHYPSEFSRRHTIFNMNELTFAEIRAALHGEGGRSVELSEAI